MSEDSPTRYYQKKQRKYLKKASSKASKSLCRKKNKNQEYGCKRDKNLSEDKKERLVEYGK